MLKLCLAQVSCDMCFILFHYEYETKLNLSSTSFSLPCLHLSNTQRGNGTTGPPLKQILSTKPLGIKPFLSIDGAMMTATICPTLCELFGIGTWGGCKTSKRSC
jgi:hypothetical protein